MLNIRRVLKSESTRYGYHGKESVSFRPRVMPDTGLVDPDANLCFCERLSKPALSIALLRDGPPVLGVPYVYCAPDDVSDLFASAKHGRRCVSGT